MIGWVKLHRRIKNWEWYTEKNMVQVLVHFILKANHEKKTWRGLGINEGQFVSSYSNLSQETGLSVQEIRTCINKMKATNELTSQATNKYSVFTLNSWFLYQNEIDSNKQVNSHNLTS